MRLIHALLYAVVVASLLLVGSCCCTGGLDDDEIDPGLPGVVNYTSTGDTDSGTYGGYTIASGTVVTGVSSHTGLGISVCPETGFVGEVYGSAGFTPFTVTFSSPVTLTIPVTAADGTYSVYRYNGSTWVNVGNATVASGVATFTSTSFGCFIVGDMHNEGGGGSV